jgi:hypothetical protein
MLYHLALVLLLSIQGFAYTHNLQHVCGEDDDRTVELDSHVTYRGTHKDGVESFLGIKYASTRRSRSLRVLALSSRPIAQVQHVHKILA